MDTLCRFVILVACTGYTIAMNSLLETAKSSEGTLRSVWHVLWRGDALHFSLLLQVLLLPISAVAGTYMFIAPDRVCGITECLLVGVMEASTFLSQVSF